MSLINDALKETRRIQPQNPPANPPPLPSVELKQQERPAWLVPGIIILLLAAAGIFVGLSLSKRTPLAASTRPVINPPAASTASKPVAVPPVVANTATNTTAVAVAPPKPPEPKLQGILFSATRPCAIVSGKTIFVGDHIDNFSVTAISKDTITLQNAKETKVLSLNPQ